MTMFYERKDLAYLNLKRLKAAERESKQSGGALSVEDVQAIYERHPDFAPGGQFYTEH